MLIKYLANKQGLVSGLAIDPKKDITMKGDAKVIKYSSSVKECYTLYPVNSEKKMIGEVVGAIEHAPQSGRPMKFKDVEES